MNLQILVNHFQEDKDIVKRFLSSLDIQDYKNFEVILYSDGGDVKLGEEDLDYSFPIFYKYVKHCGVCNLRNQMFDESTADYVMFCDIDDMFSSADGLSSLMKVAEEQHPDIIGSSYDVEYFINNKIEIKVYKKDVIRVHGKIFKRDYIVENDIRFPDMEFSGDMSFLWLAYVLTKDFVWIDNNFYVWKYNSNSVTRKNKDHFITTYEKVLECYSLLLEDLSKRERPDLRASLIATLFGMMYVDMCSPRWKTFTKKDREKTERVIRTFVLEHYKEYFNLTQDYCQKRFDIMVEYKEADANVCKMEDIPTWIKWLLDEVSDILIIGYGVVGHNLAEELKKLKPAVYDKYKNIDTRKVDKYHIAFICVDTPRVGNNPCDMTEVQNAIDANPADIYVIKSTILPGSVDVLKDLTGKRIIFSPEYYGGTQHCNNFNFDFTILGGDKEDCIEVIQRLQNVYDGRHQFRMTDAKSAELAKYMENAWLATKVSFCNQFYNIANAAEVDYEELRELFILDPRVNESHTFVYRDHPYWDSHCLNKDVAAIAERYDADLLKEVIKFNERQKMM